ncbi:MAG: hypothetical protein HQL46_00075 [Gammaproteobacteria bacterium]|nr:hypothetical protein [Gammaproteobacteria bacterium]
MLKKILKSEDIALIPLMIVACIWQYYIGYIMASFLSAFVIYALISLFTNKSGDNGAITALGIGAIPILLIIALSIWANQSDTGKMIEIGLIFIAFLSALFEAIGNIKVEIEREKRWADGTAQKELEKLYNKKKTE